MTQGRDPMVLQRRLLFHVLDPQSRKLRWKKKWRKRRAGGDRKGVSRMRSYRNTLEVFLKPTAPPPPTNTLLPLLKVGSPMLLGRAWVLHESSCNKHSWRAHSSINVQTAAVLGLTLIHTLIKGNPFNQKIWLPGYSKCGPWSIASCNSAT